MYKNGWQGFAFGGTNEGSESCSNAYITFWNLMLLDSVMCVMNVSSVPSDVIRTT